MNANAALLPWFGSVAPTTARAPFGLSDASVGTAAAPVEAKAETLTDPPVRQWRIPTFRGDMVIRAEAPYAWFDSVLGSMVKLLGLDEGWDSYGARRIEPSAMLRGLDLLTATMGADTPVPLVVPSPRGGLQFEWHLSSGEIEVEILLDHRFSLYAEDATQGGEIEVEGDLRAVRRPLAEALSRIDS